MMDPAERLAIENEALREEVRQLRAQLGIMASQADVARCCERLRVTPNAARLLLALLDAPRLTRAEGLAVMPARMGRSRDERATYVVTNAIAELRHALPAGCGIGTIPGVGYAITDEAKARIRALLADAPAPRGVAGASRHQGATR